MTAKTLQDIINIDSAHRVRLGAPSRKYLFFINGAPRHPYNS